MSSSLVRKLVLAGSCWMALVVSVQAQAQNLDAMNEHLYLETKGAVGLHLPVELPDGRKVLAPMLTVGSQSILRFDVRTLAKTLEKQRSSPEEVNRLYIEGRNPLTSPARQSKNGWVCGVRVTDVLDENLRETVLIDRDDFCVSLTQLPRMTALESNGDVALASYQEFSTKKDLGPLQGLGRQLDEIDEQDAFGPRVYEISDAKLISPLKNCGQGCLHATSEFGMRVHPRLRVKRLHKGIDLRARIGTPVVSVEKGVVLAHRTERNKAGKVSGYGHYVIVVHAEAGLQTLYAHLSKFEGRAGRRVARGDLIALSGNSGLGTGPHLHFETHVKTKKSFVPQNPRPRLSHLFKGVASFLLKVFDFGRI